MSDFDSDLKKIKPHLKKSITCTSSKCELDMCMFSNKYEKKD